MRDWQNLNSVFLDILDKSRQRHNLVNYVLEKLIDKNIQLYTSSDIISTISYFLQKILGIKETILNIGYTIESVEVLSSTNSDF